jgi:16S rRNA (uracil1498-N3)-methyltransferase
MRKHMHKTDEKHLFAVYVGHLFTSQKLAAGDSVLVTDQDVVHRIVTVLRMQIGDKLILFDESHNYQITILDIKKNKALTILISSIATNPKPDLEIHFVLPLLKKEALEEAVYSLTEVGVSSINLVVTGKSQKQLTDKEMVRLHKVKVSAAEQSKYFAMPTISKPMAWEKFCAQADNVGKAALLFDPSGKPALELLLPLHQQKIKKITCLIGPEGGLLSSEIQMASQLGFRPCKLTATVLRAVQAAAVGAGLIASIL